MGYLLLEHTHANPVLVTFCRLLIKTINDRKASEEAETKDLSYNNLCSSKFIFTNRSLIGSLIDTDNCVHHIFVMRQPRESHIMDETSSR